MPAVKVNGTGLVGLCDTSDPPSCFNCSGVLIFDAVRLVDLPAIPWREARGLAGGIARCLLQGFFVDVDHIATFVFVIFQRRPRDWIVVRTYPKETTKLQHSVFNLAAYLVDHEIVNRSQLLSFRI